jgi:hypothetical protein
MPGSFAWSETYRDIAIPLGERGWRVIGVDCRPSAILERPADHDYSRTAQAGRLLISPTRQPDASRWACILLEAAVRSKRRSSRRIASTRADPARRCTGLGAGPGRPATCAIAAHRFRAEFADSGYVHQPSYDRQGIARFHP